MGKGRYKKKRKTKKTKRPRLRHLMPVMDLVFINLYDDNFGVIVDTRERWVHRRTLIMPDGFVPLLNKEYRCSVVESQFGSFIYNDEEFKLAFATIQNQASIIDKIDYRLKNGNYESPFVETKGKGFATLGDAIKIK